jgi:AcrR family transcriptional regulator
MARTVNEEAYVNKRNAILDTAQRLIYTKGYEQMTIRDIVDNLQISKGAFYHYFDSKIAVLEALMERVIDDMENLLLPIVHDGELPALAKLQQLFSVSVRWKTVHREYVADLARALYADENVLYRQKTRVRSIEMMAPLLAEIIRQGIREGVMNTAYPDVAGEMVMALALDMGESLVPKLLASSQRYDGALRIPPEFVSQAGQIFAAYSDAMERILGAPTGSVTLMDAETLREWEEELITSPPTS